ncbi:hypothetical protein HGRIS_012633 [Hohenbuehelia grisea]|uniref:TNT domain-containing protein n=1 Tax=Hohenbuehelia grisea TaxID=104357 RepID=A0ABR3IT02_9AGAR
MRVLAITYAIATALTLVSASPLPLETQSLTSRAAPDCGEVNSEKYCEGITPKVHDPQYLCGDERLGPVTLPSRGPVAKIIARWERFGDLCPAAYIAKWTKSDGSWEYPSFKGFAVDGSGTVQVKEVTLTVGMALDRFGSEFGQYLADAGAPYAARAIPPSNLNTYKGSTEHPNNYYKYVVEKEFSAEAGPVAPWFGQKGMGMQYLVGAQVGQLVTKGYLRRVDA